MLTIFFLHGWYFCTKMFRWEGNKGLAAQIQKKVWTETHLFVFQNSEADYLEDIQNLRSQKYCQTFLGLAIGNIIQPDH